MNSRAFVDAIGAYLESRSMQTTEMDMRDRFGRQGPPPRVDGVPVLRQGVRLCRRAEQAAGR